MDSKETAQALMDSLQRGRFDTAKTFLSDDFRISGFAPKPLNSKTWLNMIANLADDELAKATLTTQAPARKRAATPRPIRRGTEARKLAD